MDLDKYVTDVYKNIDKDNMYKIINFLTSKGCNFIEELLSDYLDIFLIDIEEFIIKFNKLNNTFANSWSVFFALKKSAPFICIFIKNRSSYNKFSMTIFIKLFFKTK